MLLGVWCQALHRDSANAVGVRRISREVGGVAFSQREQPIMVSAIGRVGYEAAAAVAAAVGEQLALWVLEQVVVPAWVLSLPVVRGDENDIVAVCEVAQGTSRCTPDLAPVVRSNTSGIVPFAKCTRPRLRRISGASSGEITTRWMAEPSPVVRRRLTARRIMVGLLVGSTRGMPFNRSAMIG